MITPKAKMTICAILIAIITIIACGDGGDDNSNSAHINGNCDNCRLENSDRPDFPTAVIEP